MKKVMSTPGGHLALSPVSAQLLASQLRIHMPQDQKNTKPAHPSKLQVAVASPQSTPYPPLSSTHMFQSMDDGHTFFASPTPTNSTVPPSNYLKYT